SGTAAAFSGGGAAIGVDRVQRLQFGDGPVGAAAAIVDGEKRRVAAGGGGVDGQHALGGVAQEVVRAAGLEAGAGQAFAAEGLGADHGADHVAVDVHVADPGAGGDVFGGLVYAGVN